MAMVFRKSVFGFNREDVMEYIEKSHRTYSEKEKEFEKRIDELTESINSLSSQNDSLKLEKLSLQSELKKYTDKAEEIEQLSQNIGKLYLVAQTNAKTIVESGTKSLDISRKEVDKNLYSLDLAHKSLNELREQIVETSNGFVKQVEELLSSLDTAKDKIDENTSLQEEKISNFKAVFADITK